MERETAPPDGE